MAGDGGSAITTPGSSGDLIWPAPRTATEMDRASTHSLSRCPRAGAGGEGGKPDMGAVLWFIKSSANLNV